jgi:hypothetical protein
MSFQGTTRTDPYERNYRIRLLPKVMTYETVAPGSRAAFADTVKKRVASRLNRSQHMRWRWLRRNKTCRQERHTSLRKPSRRSRLVGTAW